MHVRRYGGIVLGTPELLKGGGGVALVAAHFSSLLLPTPTFRKSCIRPCFSLCPILVTCKITKLEVLLREGCYEARSAFFL